MGVILKLTVNMLEDVPFPHYMGVIPVKRDTRIISASFPHYMGVIPISGKVTITCYPFPHYMGGLSSNITISAVDSILFHTYTWVILPPLYQSPISDPFTAHGGYNYYNLVTNINVMLTFYMYYVMI